MKSYILNISLFLLLLFGVKISAQDEVLDIYELKELNTNSDEFSQLFSDSVTMIFTSSVRNPLSEKVVANSHNMYVSNLNGEQWTEPKRLNYLTNSDSHESSVGISKSKKTLYVYKTYNGGDIYSTTKKENGRWSPLKRMSFNTQYHECSASNFNNIIYFVSDRPDGKGMHDIYYTVLENGKWSKPENLSVLNSELDENHVYVANDGNTIYFSSKGHKSLGGYDIFKSEKDKSGNWTIPINLGKSINTEYNEISFSKDFGGNIYFSSDRPNDNAEGYNLYYNKDKKIKLKVPLLLLGLAPIEQAEIAELNQVKDSVTIYGYKQDMPKYFEVDISQIEDTNQISYVKDLIVDKKVEILDDPKEPIYDIKPIFKKKENLDWENVKAEIDIDIKYCKVQVGTFSQLRSIIDFNEKFPMLGDKVMMISSERYTRYLMHETFTDIDSAAMLQKRCLYEYHSVPDTFIAVYDGRGNRRIIYFNLETEKYMLLKPEEQTRDIFSID